MLGNIIVINRGDTTDLGVKVLDAGETVYFLTPEDTLYFGLMDPHQPFEFALVKKKLTSKDMSSTGGFVFKLKSSDTIDLMPGVYYYAVKLHRVSKELKIDEVITVIDKTKFIIND